MCMFVGLGLCDLTLSICQVSRVSSVEPHVRVCVRTGGWPAVC